MTPQEFVNKWKNNALSERASAQEHFLDLCRLFGHPTPAEVDRLGTDFTFERGLTKSGGGGGFADVWKRGSFAWEYKKTRRNLDQALEQLTRYASALENPPIHVACDTNDFKIVTAWTNLIPATHELKLEDLLDPDKRRILHNVFHDVEALRPERTRERLTREAADKFTTIADRLNHRHPDREAVAHFINQLAFCFFAEDVGLLPRDPVGGRDGYFTRLLKNAQKNPASAKPMLDGLFEAMQHGGPHGIEEINHFNGGLFDHRRAFPLQADELRLLAELGRLEWDKIDPTIFGTLFERFLDPGKRKQIGAHYTDPEKIMMIVDPVIVRPLTREWEETRTRIEGLLDGSIKPPKSERTRGTIKPMEAAIGVREAFLERLRKTKVLDPACGSGNFLYLALRAIKTIENRALLESEALGLPPQFPTIGPEIVRGIELNPVAAELARTTIWIGHIQWEIENMVGVGERPILKRLDNIECRDALVTRVSPLPRAGEGAERSEAGDEVAAPSPPSPLEGEGSRVGGGSDEHGTTPTPSPSPQGGGEPGAVTYVEAEWPEAEFIVGNPPFLGGKRLRRELGDEAVETLFAIYDGRVPREADLVTYWFEKARRQIADGRTRRAGLVATNSIRGGANRRLLERVIVDAPIFEAWSDEPWVVEGAAVRVSLVCFGERDEGEGLALDGQSVENVHGDLTGTGEYSHLPRLRENAGTAFIGTQKTGSFEVPGETARDWLRAAINVNGRPNSDVVRPWLNGDDLVGRPTDYWIVDFGPRRSRESAAAYERPFEHLRAEVYVGRQEKREKRAAANWWIMQRPRPFMRAALLDRNQYIATPRVSKHRVFTFQSTTSIPDTRLVVIAREDLAAFGVLSSSYHAAWALKTCSWHGVGNDPTYNAESVFQTFPFPEGLTPNSPAAEYADDPRAIRIAAAAKALDENRRAWLNPPDLVEIVPEIVPTAAPGEEPVKYPDRILPKSEAAAEELKKRTLTKLYNERPQWLADLHAELDRAVAAAYGWPEDISTEAALERLLALNLERAAAGR